MENRKYLPFQRIIAVARSNSSDVNQIFTRYLAKMSPDFSVAYSISADGDGIRYVDLSTKLQAGTWLAAPDNVHVDSYVTFYDGSIGYYLLVDPPLSAVAFFCRDDSCSSVVNPTDSYSLSACEADSSTYVRLAATSASYDLMFSTAINCYPIVATVDYTVLLQKELPSCSLGENGVVHQSVKFGSWMFNGTVMVQPLNSLSIAGTSPSVRYDAQQNICKIECGGQYLGYNYCSYRKCSWDAGDYVQVVSHCDPRSEKRRVEYVVTPGNICIQNTDQSPESPVYISCDYVDSSSATGIVCYFLCTFGIAFSLYLLTLGVYNRKERKFRKSQPIYVYVFLIGAIIMNCTVFAYVGPSKSTSCLLRPWMYNLALTIMYGPLVMKLYAVEKMFFSTKIKKIVSSERRVLLEILGLVLVDLVILLCWSLIDYRGVVVVHVKYGGLLDDVSDVVCSSGNVAEYIMLGYKVCVLGLGMFKAVTTWHVSTDISEAKQFSVAIALGTIAYFMSIFVSLNISTTVLIRCVGIFLSGTMSVALIMIPKFMKRKGPRHAVHPSNASSFMSLLSGIRRASGMLDSNKDSDISEHSEKSQSQSVSRSGKFRSGGTLDRVESFLSSKVFSSHHNNTKVHPNDANHHSVREQKSHRVSSTRTLHRPSSERLGSKRFPNQYSVEEEKPE